MTDIIAVVNQKGGVAKTTTAIHVGVALAHLGKKVLLVDLDSQGHLAEGFGIVADKIAQERAALVGDLLLVVVGDDDFAAVDADDAIAAAVFVDDRGAMRDRIFEAADDVERLRKEDAGGGRGESEAERRDERERDPPES